MNNIYLPEKPNSLRKMENVVVENAGRIIIPISYVFNEFQNVA